MKTLYDEILSGMLTEKQASEGDSATRIEDLSTGELRKLAAELSELTGDTDLAQMAKILPVYGAHSDVDNEAQVSAVISDANPDVTPSPVETEAAKEDISVIASSDVTEEEKNAAEDDKKDDKKDEAEKDDKKDEGKKDDKDKKECAGGACKSATETLLEMLKVAADEEEFNDAIDKIAEERAYAMIKEAEDMETARVITDAAAKALTPDPMKAHEYSQQLMDQARTVAAKSDVPIPQAAQAVSAEVISKAASVEKQAEYFLGLISKEAASIEDAYIKLAEDAGAIAEQVIKAQGQQAGLQGVGLHEYVQKAMDDVKTVAAKKDVNLPQAAQMYIAGDRGSIAAANEPISPSPAQAPNPIKAPINSNQTQSPDDYFAQMVNDPNLAKAAFEFVAAVEKQAAEEGVNFNKEASRKEMSPDEQKILNQSLLGSLVGVTFPIPLASALGSNIGARLNTKELSPEEYKKVKSQLIKEQALAYSIPGAAAGGVAGARGGLALKGLEAEVAHSHNGAAAIAGALAGTIAGGAGGAMLGAANGALTFPNRKPEKEASQAIDLGLLKQAMEYVTFCKDAVGGVISSQQ